MCLLTLLLASTAPAQFATGLQVSNTTESLRGVSALSRDIVWASGTRGTYLRTTDGRTWAAAQVPGGETLDFRGVVAFSAAEAFLMSAGSGDLSRIYHTADAGRTWQLQFANSNPKGFFDSMVFWDRTHGMVLGDPVPDESGTLKFELLFTDDGQTWHTMPTSQLPPAVEGEGAFAASNTCIAILRTEGNGHTPGHNIWFATGGKVARVFHSADRGKTWQAFETPIVHGLDSSGIFSIAFRDEQHGVIAGGDYKHPNDEVANLATTDDGGRTWRWESSRDLRGHISAVALDRTDPKRIFFVGPDYVAVWQKRRWVEDAGQKFYAGSPYPGGGAVFVGPKGAIGAIR